MSKKKKHNVGEGDLGPSEERLLEPETEDTGETPVHALVSYIRYQEDSQGIFNSAHGPLLILDPEKVDELLTAVEGQFPDEFPPGDLPVDPAPAEAVEQVELGENGHPVLGPEPEVINSEAHVQGHADPPPF